MQPPLPDRIQLPLRFNSAALRQDLEALGATDWISHFVTQNYTGDWSVLPLRGKAGATHPVMMIYSDPGCTEFADTPFLKICPYYQQVLASLECPLHSVRLMRLTPGSVIKEHCDHDLSAETGNVRLHLPITTNPDVDFFINGTRVIMQPGELWYLRLADRHSVVNRGDTDRVHLVIDAIMNPWLEAQLRADTTPEKSGVSGVENFRQLVLDEPSLQEQLAAITDRDAFLVRALELAQQNGHPILPTEMEGALAAAGRAWRESRMP